MAALYRIYIYILGRALGHFIYIPLLGLRGSYLLIFSKALKAPPSIYICVGGLRNPRFWSPSKFLG